MAADDPIRVAHLEVGDCWYSCPKSPRGCCNDAEPDECNCGADRINAYIESLEQRIAELEARA